jgi:F420-dependent oxidoreductase-like protein
MKVGLQINRFDYPGGNEKIGRNFKNIAVAAENAGFESIWVMDHFFQLPMIGDYTEPMLEAYSALSFLAGVTSKVKLGTMVTGVIYRDPAVLLNAVTTLDVLSDGRAYFGIGAGWNDQEAKALGLLDPLNSKRFDRLEDILKLAHQVWKDDRTPFKGKIYNLPEPVFNPQPVSKPHPPILVGGGGESKTLRYVAEYADACNLFAGDMESLKHKLDVLKKHCEEVNRDYSEIQKTSLARISSTDAANNPQELIDTAKSLNDVGIDHIIIMASKDADPASYEKLADTVKSINNL